MESPPKLLQRPGEKDGAAATFDRVLAELRRAQSRVEIFMYVWRCDTIGNEVGRAVLAAADRGVRVRIIKDVGAFLYERIEMNRKSFFNKKIPAWRSLAYRMLAPTFPDTYVEDEFDFSTGDALMSHPGVSIEWVNKTHTKYYIFDETTILTGSINIEDRHRGYFDCMLALEGRETVRRLRARMRGETAPDDGARPVEFFVNAHDAGGADRFEILPRILELVRGAGETIDVEMAYLGDEAVTAALVEAARRGVRIRFLFSPEANIGNEINHHTMRRIAESAPVEVFFTPKMIHSKTMIFDDRVVMTGSANLSVFSLRKAGELNVEIRDASTVAAFRELFRDRLDRSRKMENPHELAGYSALKATLQQWHQKLNP
jgi:cardiolipin synthase